MEKKHKIMIGLGLGVLLIGGIMIYRRNKKREEALTETTVLLESDSTTTATSTTSESSIANQYPPTPFKVQKAGDTFRTWVNKWHPDYAKEIDLDPKGKIDNSYIRKAWQKYGQEYINAGGKI